MATTTSTQTTTYTGPLSSLPTTSPGLHFLKKYLPLIDILDQSQTSTHELSTLVKPGAPFTSNCSAAIPFEQVLGMLKMREGMLSFFTHGTEDIAAFDLEIEGGPGGGGGGRKVVCEVDSITVFRADPKQEKIKVYECLMFDLEKAPAGKGVDGVWATECKVYMDMSAVHAKGRELGLGPKKD